MIQITQAEEATILILRTMKKATQEGRMDLMPDLNNKLAIAVTRIMTE